MNYAEQYKEIENLLNRIRIKSKNFSETTKNPHYEDLSYVLNELRDIDNFMGDKCLDNNQKDRKN